MIRRILGLCSRDHGHSAMYEMLDSALLAFKAGSVPWENLVYEAEAHGVAPLLLRHLDHLGFILPDGTHRTLRALQQRCRHANRIRNTVVAEILDGFRREKICCLPVKGIALANTVYAAPELRPMRDIDLLIGDDDLERARALLVDLGFEQEQDHEIPEGYYHLPPLLREIDGLPVTIELHRSLLPLDGTYPQWPLETLFDSSMSFTINGIATATLGLERNLLYLYLHGLRAPLTYEPFRFVHIADLFGLVQRYFDAIDWHTARALFPDLGSILSLLHFVTPWPEEIVTALRLDVSRPPAGVAEPYRGWPLIRLKKSSAARLPLLVKETLWPPQWWTQVYYGKINGAGYVKVRLVEHPRTVWRWIKGEVRNSI